MAYKNQEFRAKWMLAKYHKRREEIIKRLGNKCAKCGAQENLEIDHKDHEDKQVNLARSWYTKAVDTELAKCQLLCKPCHKNKTAKEGSYGKGWTNEARLVHGSVWTYQQHECRCRICRKGYKFARAKWRSVRGVVEPGLPRLTLNQ